MTRPLRTGRSTDRGGIRFLLWVVAAALLAFGCGEEVVPSARLVIVYAPCTVNRDVLAPYDASVAFTPNLAAFARRSITFDHHATEAGSSGIAYASLFSGRQADGHGVYRHPTRLPEELLLVSEAYAAEGYETFFWGAHRMASAELGYAQGVSPGNAFRRRLNARDPAFQQVLARLKSDSNYRAMIVTNFSVTHGPYPIDPVARFLASHPEEAEGIGRGRLARFQRLYRDNHLALSYNFDESLVRLGVSADDLPDLVRSVEVLYRANVHHLDRLFGAVVSTVEEHGLLQDSLIAFTADHGETLFRPNVTFPWTHSGLVASEVIGVPLVVSLPGGARAGERYEGVSRSIDVLPTLAGLSGFPALEDSGIAGVDLSAAVLGQTPAPELSSFSHTSVLPQVVYERMQQPGADTTWGYRKVFEPRPDIDRIWVALGKPGRLFKHRNLDGSQWGFQAFDLTREPRESENIFDSNDADHQMAKQALVAYKAHLVESHRASLEDQLQREVPESEQEEALRALGYIQ